MERDQVVTSTWSFMTLRAKDKLILHLLLRLSLHDLYGVALASLEYDVKTLLKVI